MNRWLCPERQDYQAPPGCYDSPFIYVLDSQDIAAGLVGNIADGLRVRMDGDGDFILRRVAGVQNLAGIGSVFQVYDGNGVEFFSVPIQAVDAFAVPNVWYDDFIVCPEKTYPRTGELRVDLSNFTPNVKASGVSGGFSFPRGEMIFQGVKRRHGEGKRALYPYYEKPYILRYNFLLDWIGCVFSGAGAFLGFNTPHTFQVNVDNYDFEILYMNLYASSGGAIGFYPVIGGNPVMRLMLYDEAGIQVYKQPVNCDYIFNNAMGTTGTTIFTYPMGLSPALVYRAKSVIKFDVYSLLLALDLLPVPTQLEIEFVGVQRIPCGGKRG